MGNNLNKDITGRFVLVRSSGFKDPAQGSNTDERVFLAKGGFGCKPHTMGTAVFGEFVADGEQCRVEGYDLDVRLASRDEVDSAVAERMRRQVPGNPDLLLAQVQTRWEDATAGR